jgi:16S rRNA (uracil1498-N3)-methyltransferase
VSRVPRLFAPNLPASGRVRLADDEVAHLVRVLRARPGDVVRLFDGAGREAECVVESAGRDGAVVVVGRDVAAPRAARDVILCTSVPRGERMEWLVEKAVEAGAAAIVPLAADRSVRKEAGANARRRWARAAVEAAKQCGRAVVPDVEEPVVLDEAIARTAGATRLVATPGTSARVGDLLPPAGVVAVFVGPEGGFGPDETAALAAAGASPFGLGPFVLRVETAAFLAVHLAATGPARPPVGGERA